MGGRVVAIIGGGASGALAALHLTRLAPGGARVVVVEPSAELGRGVAYGTTDPSHLLNVRAGCLSAYPEDPDHFREWARRRPHAGTGDFLPRSVYGAYLRSQVADVEHLQARAVHVLRSGRRLQIVLSDGIHCQADRVILAPGSSPSRWPSGLGGIGPRWIVDPWAPGALDAVPLEQPVLLLGTGLTAVDVALSLHAGGHRHIVAVSRHGLVPLGHPDESQVPAWPPWPEPVTARAVLAWARQQRDGPDWSALSDGLRPHADRLWAAMSPSEQGRFLRHVRRYWEVLRHRMAPSVATRVELLRQAGELTMCSGGVASARSTRHGVRVTLAQRQLTFGAVINCTGPMMDVRQTRHPLVRRLLDHGIVRPGPHGLGLEADPGGCLPGTEGMLWLVGPLRRGHTWETTAIPEIRDQAAELALSLGRVDATIGA
jgi:uncharacterized NAD(P)/FAD-binding protein YdhS